MVCPFPSFASIPDTQSSCTYYQLLGISPDEQDPRVIEEAALGRAGHFRAYQLTCESECALRLNEIAQALITLLDPVRRWEYDRGLGKVPGQAVLECRSPQQWTAAGEGSLGLLVREGRACDLKLVYLAGSRSCSSVGPARPFPAGL